ncbi:MAG: Maf family protein [Bdellovibrionales bacterium]|nr:Maf family protein [Bdellovibrionales bacterium]
MISYLFETPQVLSVSFDEPEGGKESSLSYLEKCVGLKWTQASAVWRGFVAGQKEAQSSGLLVADTIVSIGGHVLGKPKNRFHAESMLASMAGKTHSVFTGFQLGRASGPATFRDSGLVVVESRVKFRSLSAKQIRAYVETREPMDKAGAYGLQERGLLLVERVSGPYSNVIGLPIERLRKAAAELHFA